MTDTKGVAYNPPPLNMAAAVQSAVAAQMANVPANHRNAIVGVATDAGMNAAIMKRNSDGTIKVIGYLGKSWGSAVTGGGYVEVSW